MLLLLLCLILRPFPKDATDDDKESSIIFYLFPGQRQSRDSTLSESVFAAVDTMWQRRQTDRQTRTRLVLVGISLQVKWNEMCKLSTRIESK